MDILLYLVYFQCKYTKYNINHIIRKISIELLNQEIVVSSWGIENIKVNVSSICFHVTGFKYCGNICICGISDEVDINFEEANFCMKNIKISNIVEIMDSIIETDEKYINNLNHWLDKISND